jgi:hypothetical protein
MKKWIGMITALLVLTAGAAWAKGHEVEKQAGDFKLTIQMERTPPVVGENGVQIAITDKAGKAVADAKVTVVASMPAMPGMPAMESKADAKWDGGKYKGKVNLSMGGSWNMSVRISQGGKTATARWTVDAR